MISLFSSFLILATSAKLSFSQPPAIIHIGDEFRVYVYVSSGRRQTTGTDAVIVYDPKILSLTKILPGTAYPIYPPNLQDIDNLHGKTRISGIINQNSPLVAEGVFAEVFFKAKRRGTTKIGFDWQPDQTDESNIVPFGGGIDLLTEKPEEINVVIEPTSFWQKILELINKFLGYLGL